MIHWWCVCVSLQLSRDLPSDFLTLLSERITIIFFGVSTWLGTVHSIRIAASWSLKNLHLKCPVDENTTENRFFLSNNKCGLGWVSFFLSNICLAFWVFRMPTRFFEFLPGFSRLRNNPNLQFSSVQFRVVSMRLGKPIYDQTRLSGVSPTIALETVSMLVWLTMTMALSRPLKEES